MIVCEEVLQTNSKLVQIIGALSLLRRRFRSGQCRKQQRRENSDDGNHHQQFNERERLQSRLAAILSFCTHD